MARTTQRAVPSQPTPGDVTETAVAVHVDPRVRMKEIRTEVNAYFKGENPKGLAHLGQLPETMEDARRVIVALHDLYETEREKHRKATAHICDFVHIGEALADSQDAMMDMLFERDHQIRYLQQRLETVEKYNADVIQQAKKSAAERDALLTTMRLQANMTAPENKILSYEEAFLMAFPTHGTVTGRFRR